ncbi:hypothetical protein JAAARDRAFT_63679 [Jaapia argillacea MUCL 33604]|uniref:Uncharacterized protein n=1 Tax=Jaapia argillacea MUCL 33604 TaxID=933084 RepID=A0A067P3M1_9AGAM|nr:hypothetical protein JAAARDRAFT_63679 [Jaapia argillacea MUCL 33604]
MTPAGLRSSSSPLRRHKSSSQSTFTLVFTGLHGVLVPIFSISSLHDIPALILPVKNPVCKLLVSKVNTPVHATKDKPPLCVRTQDLDLNLSLCDVARHYSQATSWNACSEERSSDPKNASIKSESPHTRLRTPTTRLQFPYRTTALHLDPTRLR